MSLFPILRAGVVGVAACAAAAPAAAQAPSPHARVIVFGDSISDGGAYAYLAPAGAGRFTTNPDPVWVEIIAAGLGLDLAPRARGGTNYAEGGARVATPRPGAPGDLTRRPVTDQVDAFLAEGGTFSRGDLVIVQGGGNDVFATQLNGLPFTEADLAVLDRAASDLAALVQRIDASGDATVVTASVPRFEVFNSRYRAALAEAGANVLYVDVAGLIAEIEANPGEFGIVNVTDRACRGRALESFTCLPADYVTSDANRTHLFADNVHFTGVVHEIEAGAVLAALQAPAQVGQLPFAAHASLEATHGGVRAYAGGPTSSEARGWVVFGWGHGGWLDLDPAPTAVGLDSDTGGATVGAARALRPWASAGAALSWSETDANFGGDAGGFRMQAVALTMFGQVRAGPFDLLAVGSYADLAFDDVERRLVLGPAGRIESGDTHGRIWAADLEAGITRSVGSLSVRPLAGLRYARVEVGAYAERGDRSTQITYGDQKLETLLGEIGTEVSWPRAGGGRLSPFVRVAYRTELLDDDRDVSITPHGAPVPFTTAAHAPGGDGWTYAAGVSADLRPGLKAVVEVGAREGGALGDATLLRVGARGSF